jgi:hypothetical protein
MSVVVTPQLIAIQRNQSWPNLARALSSNVDGIIAFIAEQFPHHIPMENGKREAQMAWCTERFGICAIGENRWTHGTWASVSSLRWPNTFMFSTPENAIEFRMHW